MKEKALKLFSSRLENVQKELLCQKFKKRFDRKDQKEILQITDETLEKFAEKIELSTEAFSDSLEFFRRTITIDAFLRGCIEKGAALVS